MSKWDPLELRGLNIFTFSVQHLDWKHVFKGRSLKLVVVIIVQSLSPTLHDPMDGSMPGFPVLHYFLEFAQIHVHWVTDAVQPSHPLPPLLHLSSVFPSFRAFSNEFALCIRWPKYWGFSFSISPSNKYSGLISFRIDWFDLFTVQGTLWSLLQHHSLKASILQCSAFFIVQLSHPHMTPGKLNWIYFMTVSKIE